MVGIKLMTESWQTEILKNFNIASFNYDSEATLQKHIAKLLAIECAKQKIVSGQWVDLGAGTGFLADLLEEFTPNESVLRVDASENMLAQNSKGSSKKVWDLNYGLPPDLTQSPNLIASSFALHWLNNPQAKVKEWLSYLAPKGWLAISVPILGSFPEWYQAASLAKVPCTAINFPSHDSLLKVVEASQFHYYRIEKITQKASKATSLLKPLIQVGAQATQQKSLTIGQWRKLENSWPSSRKKNEKQLTWLIQILLAQK